MKMEQFEKELDMKLASLKEEMMQKFEAEQEKQEEEFPKVGDGYYYITSDGDICYCTWKNDEFDRDVSAMGNRFKTEEAVKFECERRRVITELKKYEEPKDRKWDGENNHCYFLWDYIRNRFVYFYRSSVKGESIYFESEEKAKKAVESVGADRVKKYYLGVE